MKTPKEYEKEKDSFYLLETIQKNNTSLCFTDEENYLIGKFGEYPTWIWTKETISDKKVAEVKELLKKEYLNDDYRQFTCKKKMYEKLSSSFPTKDYFEMGFLSCKKLNSISLSSGFMDTPTESDRETLKKYWKEFQESMHLDVRSKDKDIEKEVDSWYKDNKFFLWRNQNGKVVSIAAFKLEDKMAKISHVYTPKEERRKGYCASLIYSITKMLLEKKYQPMLYTDENYEASNNAYKKVGYQEKTVLINFKMKNL